MTHTPLILSPTHTVRHTFKGSEATLSASALCRLNQKLEDIDILVTWL